MEKWINFRAQHCQKHRLYGKKFQIKLVKILISYKKLSGCTCLPFPYNGAAGFEIL